VKWKTFAVLYSQFIQYTVCQLLSELVEFCRRYDKNMLAYFFLGHGVDSKNCLLQTCVVLTVTLCVAPF